MSNLSGECLCGEISYSCNQEPVLAGHCQCSDCQKISGAGHIGSIAVPRGSLIINGNLAFHENQAESGNTVRRGFCPKCGSHIYAENSAVAQLEFIRAGSLHDLELFKPTMVVYASSGASWDHMDPALAKFDRMPEM